MIRKTTYIILITFLSTSLFGQTQGSTDDDYALDGDDYVLPADSIKVKDKLHYSFEMGAGFGYSNTFGNYFGTYYKPTIIYDVSPRFSINTGLTYVNSSVDNFPVIADYNYQLFSGNISQYYAFVGGQYKVTDKLSVGGSVFYNLTSYTAMDGTSLQGGSGMDNLGYSANFKYKVSKSLTIEGEIRVNDKNPYHQNFMPFSSSYVGFGNSFYDR